MALTAQVSNQFRNVSMDAVAVEFNGALIRIYDGVQPANAQTAVTTQVLLAELAMGSPAFGASAAGVITANAITSDASANATGTASWFRIVKADGTTVLVDGSVGTSGANMNLNNVSIAAAATVAISALTLTMPAAGT